MSNLCKVVSDLAVSLLLVSLVIIITTEGAEASQNQLSESSLLFNALPVESVGVVRLGSTGALRSARKRRSTGALLMKGSTDERKSGSTGVIRPVGSTGVVKKT